MKKVLIVYPQMMLGGSTTSLLSLLSELNSDKYQIDLFLIYRNGPYDSYIPEHINVLPWGHRFQSASLRKINRVISPKLLYSILKSKIIAKKYNSDKAGYQYISSVDREPIRRITENYDVAIGFIEGYCNKYVAEHIKAERKIAWIHIDYEKSGYFPEFDLECYSNIDRIITVSEECRKSFVRVFPQYLDKCLAISNVLSQKRVLAMSQAKVEDFEVAEGTLKLVTTCRIDFSSKGLDRAVKVIYKLKQSKVDNFDKLRWYIIGNGADSEKLKQLITTLGLSNQVIMLGLKVNPYPYMIKMDMFFLPSIREGKPMSVTEGFMLGLPAIVTDYSSAHEQVQDDIDGKIVDNSEDGIYKGIKYLLEYPEKIAAWKANVLVQDYSNVEEIRKVEAVIDGIL